MLTDTGYGPVRLGKLRVGLVPDVVQPTSCVWAVVAPNVLLYTYTY